MLPVTCNRRFLGLVTLQIAIWTLVPTITQPNLPLDAIEMLSWGNQWEWGYTKHPPLPAWAAELVFALSGQSNWSIFLLSQVCVTGSVWCLWRLGIDLGDRERAWRAAVVTLLCPYFNLLTPEFNNNIAVFPFWSWTTWCVYRGVRDQRWPSWIGGGIGLGLAILCKYSSAIIGLVLLLYLLLSNRGRRCWRTPGPWLMAATTIAVVWPHLWWLITHGAEPLAYASQRTRGDNSLLGVSLSVLGFLGTQLGVISPMFVALWPLSPWWPERWLHGATANKGIETADPTLAEPSADREEPVDELPLPARLGYLTTIAWGPLALMAVVALCTLSYLRSMYGSHLVGGIGLWVAWYFTLPPGAIRKEPAENLSTRAARIERDALRWHYGISAAIAVGCLIVGVSRDLLNQEFSHRPIRTQYPGRLVATEIDAAWARVSDAPLEWIVGDRWLAGNMGAYGSSRPSVFASAYEDAVKLSPDAYPWATESRIQQAGAVLIWPAKRWGEQIPEPLLEHFPRAVLWPKLSVHWPAAGPDDTYEIGLAVVPPAETR